MHCSCLFSAAPMSLHLRSTPDNLCSPVARMSPTTLLTSPCGDGVTPAVGNGDQTAAVIRFPPLCHSSPIDATTPLGTGSRRHNCDLLPAPVLSTFRREHQQPENHLTSTGYDVTRNGRDMNRNRLSGGGPVVVGGVGASGGRASPRDLGSSMSANKPTNNCVLCTALNDCSSNGHVVRTERIADV